MGDDMRAPSTSAWMAMMTTHAPVGGTPVKTLQVELLSGKGNGAVVHLPGRRFPGVVVQGDTLRALHADVVEAREALDRGDASAARDCLQGLADQLADVLERCDAALRAHRMERPG